MNTKLNYLGDFPSSQWLHSSSNAVDASSVPEDQGAEMPHDLRPENQNRKYKQYCNKFNEFQKQSTSKKNNNLKKY